MNKLKLLRLYFKMLRDHKSYNNYYTAACKSTDAKVINIKTADICPRERLPEDVLSNLCNNNFRIDDVDCRCMESFLQSLKHKDEKEQREVCFMDGIRAQQCSTSDWQKDQIVWWKGRAINRQSSEYRRLVRRAYSTMYEWSSRFRNVLMTTGRKKIKYDNGKHDSHTTLLTDKEFCRFLTRLRASKRLEYKLVIYPRQWPNCIGIDEDYE